jgi:hypothetical protein
MVMGWQTGFAQHPGKGETVRYINELIGPSQSMSVKTGTLVVSFRDEKNRLVREDRVPASDLDLSIFYEEESGLLCIPCMKDYRECLTRILVFQKVKRRYERFSIPVADEVHYQKLKKAFDHLIRILSEVKYRETVVLD